MLVLVLVLPAAAAVLVATLLVLRGLFAFLLPASEDNDCANSTREDDAPPPLAHPNKFAAPSLFPPSIMFFRPLLTSPPTPTPPPLLFPALASL